MKFPNLERINQIKDLVDYGKILFLALRLLNSNIDLNILKLFCLKDLFKYFIINEI